jgi:hypothetical protein
MTDVEGLALRNKPLFDVIAVAVRFDGSSITASRRRCEDIRDNNTVNVTSRFLAFSLPRFVSRAASRSEGESEMHQ